MVHKSGGKFMGSSKASEACEEVLVEVLLPPFLCELDLPDFLPASKSTSLSLPSLDCSSSSSLLLLSSSSSLESESPSLSLSLLLLSDEAWPFCKRGVRRGVPFFALLSFSLDSLPLESPPSESSPSLPLPSSLFFALRAAFASCSACSAWARQYLDKFFKSSEP